MLPVTDVAATISKGELTMAFMIALLPANVATTMNKIWVMNDSIRVKNYKELVWLPGNQNTKKPFLLPIKTLNTNIIIHFCIQIKPCTSHTCFLFKKTTRRRLMNEKSTFSMIFWCGNGSSGDPSEVSEVILGWVYDNYKIWLHVSGITANCISKGKLGERGKCLYSFKITLVGGRCLELWSKITK